MTSTLETMTILWRDLIVTRRMEIAVPKTSILKSLFRLLETLWRAHAKIRNNVAIGALVLWLQQAQDPSPNRPSVSNA